MNKLPSSPCGWSAWPNPLDRIYKVLGAKPGKRLPTGKHGVFKIDGWTIVVRRGDKSRGRGSPRIFVDYAGRLVPAGRVRQALCRVDVHQSRKRAAKRRGAHGRFGWR